MKWFFSLLAVVISAVLTVWPVNLGLALQGPAITVSPVDYDAGDLTKARGNVQKVFQVINSGDSLLSIAKIKYTWSIKVVRFDPHIQPGGRGEIVIDLETKKLDGKFERYFRVLSNDANKPEVVVTIHGVATPFAFQIGHE